METLITQEWLPYFPVSLHTIKSLILMTSSLNFPNLYVHHFWYVHLFKFGKFPQLSFHNETH